MAHSRTAKKNHRKSEKRRAHNRTQIATMRTSVKKARTGVAESPASVETEVSVRRAQQMLDKAAKRLLIHPNKASRLKSRLARAKNAAAKK